MLKSALYYPNIDIDDPCWLRSTLLFWDDIQTIAPSAIKMPYRNEDTRICFEEGVVQPLHCDLHPKIIDELGSKILGMMNEKDTFLSALRRTGTGASPTVDAIHSTADLATDVEHLVFDVTGMHPRKMSPALRDIVLRIGLARMESGDHSPVFREIFQHIARSRLHPEKIPYYLRDMLDHERMSDADGDWLLVDSRFAAAYMAALASKLALQLELSPLTPYTDAHGTSFRFMFDDVVDNSRQNAEGVLLNLTMRGITIDPATPIQNLLRFKRQHRDQYLELKDQIGELSESINRKSEEGPNAILAEAKRLYATKIERGLRQLKQGLEHNSIAAVWGGAFTAATVSTSSSALDVIGGLSEPVLLGAAASIAVMGIGVSSYLVGRKLRISNPYSYLHDVKANFGLPDFG